MKKIYFYAGMLAASMVAFSSCSNDEDPINVGTSPVEGEGQVIRIAVANTGDGLTTKGGRPLVSSDADQDIDHVRIVITNSTGEVVGQHDVSNWMSVAHDYDTNGQGKEYSWRLSKDEELAVGEGYTVYAVGYSADTDYSLTYNSSETETNKDWTAESLMGESLKFVNAKLTLSDCIGEEIFAGALTEVTVNADKEFEWAEGQENVLTLHRQVTGTIGYFKNIPTFPTGKKSEVAAEDNADNYNAYLKGLRLRLVVSDQNDNLLMSGFNSAFTETGSDVQYVVNGYDVDPEETSNAKFVDASAQFDATTGLAALTEHADAYVVYEINPSLWFLGGDSNMDGYLDVNDAETADNWVTPDGISDAIPYQRGTVFAGEFLVPFAKVAHTQTMQLQLVATVGLQSSDNSNYIVGSNTVSEDAPIVVRAWNINLPEGDEQLINGTQDRHVYVLNSETGEPETYENGANDYEEKADSYSLVRNHLYTVGTIGDGTNTPEDLSKGQSLIVRVNDNWEMIHQMEIE